LLLTFDAAPRLMRYATPMKAPSPLFFAAFDAA